jgi:hypothetical protein
MQKTDHPTPVASAAATDSEALTQALSAPFDPREVKFKPGVVAGNRALALAYVDARVIQDRLDEVLGVTGWQDEYDCLPDGSVVCRLRLRLGDEWITKMDVGGPSEQPDEGDRRKAAFSDALKRAAVKFGIGRYLYRLPAQWVDYDPQRKQFTRTPALPPSALPRPNQAVRLAPPPPAAKEVASRPSALLPANGAELQKRLYDYDARLAKQGLIKAGELVKHIVASGVQAGYESDLAAWAGPAIQLAVEETRMFEARARQKSLDKKEVA